MKPKQLTKTQAKDLMAKLGEPLREFKPLLDKDSFCNPVTFVNKYVVRKINQEWHRKAEAEVSAIQFAKIHTSIPVPEIVYWDSEFIIYKKIDGENASKIWDTLSKRTQRKIMRQVISYVEEMQKYSFDKIGSLYGIKIGKVVNTQKGPFKRFDSFIISEYDKCLNDIKLPIKETFERFRKHILNYNPKMRYVFTHGDFAKKNLLIKHNSIVGVIDWEWSGSAPAILDLEELDWCDKDLVKKSSIKQNYSQKVIDIRDMTSHTMRCAYYKDWNIKDEKAYLEDVYKQVNEIMKRYE